jgi:hypothetical protein
MKTTILFAFFVCVFVWAASVKADIVATYNVTTTNEEKALSQWKLATLFQTLTDGRPINDNPNANERARDSVIENFLLDKATVKEENGTLSSGVDLTWNNNQSVVLRSSRLQFGGFTIG